ncbi:MAG: hypothetical protein AAF633_25030, partial [Chloroflexota bacterium]
MNKKVVSIHLNGTEGKDPEIISLLGSRIEISHLYCNGSLDEMVALIKEYDGEVDAIALNEVTQSISLGRHTRPHGQASQIFEPIRQSTVVDGNGLKAPIERWAVPIVNEIEPGIWNKKKVYCLPGFNHVGMIETLKNFTQTITYGDLNLYLTENQKEQYWACETNSEKLSCLVKALAEMPYAALFKPNPNKTPADAREIKVEIEKHDILAGDIELIKGIASANLQGKIVLTTHCDPDDITALKNRGVSVVVTLLPSMSHDKRIFARHSAAELEACINSILSEEARQEESQYLRLLSELKWQPTVRYLQPHQATTNIFAYVVYPRNDDDFGQFRWMSVAPSLITQRVSRFIPPTFLGHLRGIGGQNTVKHATGEAFWIGNSPQQLLKQESELVTRKLQRVVFMAEQLEARLIGVASWSREVLATLETVRHKTEIPISSGLSYTIYSAIELGVAHLTSLRSISSIRSGSAAIIYPEDKVAAIGAECLARHISHITLIGTNPQPLLKIKQTIEEIHSDCQVSVSSSSSPLDKADFIIIGRSANRYRQPIDISRMAPGAVICDFGQPANITADQAQARPDLLIIESGAVRLPTTIEKSFQFYDQETDAKLVPASLAEAALLALKSHFTDFGLLRSLESEDLYFIADLAHKYGYQIDGGFAFGKYISAADIKQRATIASNLRADPTKMEQHNRQAEVILDDVERQANASPPQTRGNGTLILAGLGVFALVAGA